METEDLFEIYANFEQYITEQIKQHFYDTQMKPVDLEIEIDLNNPDVAPCVIYKPELALFTIIPNTKLHKIIAPKLKDACLASTIEDVMINLIGVTGKTVPFHHDREAQSARFNINMSADVQLTFKGAGPYSDYTMQITITITDRDKLVGAIKNL